MNAHRSLRSRKGQPLWALGGILLFWIGARVAVFELPPWARPEQSAIGGSIVGLARSQTPGEVTSAKPAAETSHANSAHLGGAQAVSPSYPLDPALQSPILPLLERPAPVPLQAVPVFAPVSEPVQRAAGHNLLWMAAMSGAPLLPEIASALAGAQVRLRAAVPPRGSVSGASAVLWSGDAWLSWRAGTQQLLTAGPITPIYGASQAGAVLRYALAPSSPLKPLVYLRGVRALETAAESDLAAGLALRPLRAVPITAHGELRVSRRGASLEVRPAAFVSGGVDAEPIAPGITARGYAQAGIVGGRGGTPFADGSLIAETPLWRANAAEVTAGAGAWGGAQRGSGRLDIGPSASLRFRLGEGTARLSADYRLRVAGNAEPASGAALTLSASF